MLNLSGVNPSFMCRTKFAILNHDPWHFPDHFLSHDPCRVSHFADRYVLIMFLYLFIAF